MRDPRIPVAIEITVRIREPRRIATMAFGSLAIDATIPPTMNAGIQTFIPQRMMPIWNQFVVFSCGTGFVP